MQELKSLRTTVQCIREIGQADEKILRTACTTEQENYLNAGVSMQLAEAELHEVGNAPAQRMMERIKDLGKKIP